MQTDNSALMVDVVDEGVHKRVNRQELIKVNPQRAQSLLKSYLVTKL